MAQLALRVLGEFAVLRGERPLDLPPSKKTRALLAYLALNPRSMRREKLCELLWEIPDDPRGSLRWSLSKIRRLVDDPDRQRIVADRQQVALDGSDIDVDVLRLHSLASDLQHVPDEQLISAVDAFQGGFLDDLELLDFHEFYSWRIAERERATRSQARLLQSLTERLQEQPEQALPFASRLVSLLPDDEAARVVMIGLLLRLNRKAEAEQQCRIGRQRLQDAGVLDSGALARALRAQPSAPQKSSNHIGPKPLAERTLTGRSGELEHICRFINESDRSQLLLLRGEPGMGKSQLLQAGIAMAREAGAGILKASAFESEMIRPFGMWNDALRRAFPDNPTSALLGSGEPVGRDIAFHSLSELLSRESASRALVLFWDDIQWCDESSISALNYLLRVNLGRPLPVIATSRELELTNNGPVKQVLRSLRHDSLLQEIRLDALSEALMSELISRNVPGADAEGLSRVCGGNPLLGLELARAACEGGKPGSLSELVQDRMSRLNRDAETILLWAAVLSPRIDVLTLEKVTEQPREAIALALEAAEREGILRPGERGLRFSHELIARAVYEEIAATRRQAMHRRVAEILEIDTRAELAMAAELCHHAQRGGDAELAGRAMVCAGKLCLRFFANDDALELYQRGLGYAAQLGDAKRIMLTLELSEIQLMAAPKHDWESQVEDYVTLAEQALDFGALPQARLGYQMASHVRWAHGQWGDARRFSLQAERVVRGSADDNQIVGMGEAAKCLAMLERDLPRADALAMEAQAMAARIRYRCPAVSAALGMLRYYEDRAEDAVDQLEEARTMAKALGDRFNEYLANEYLALVELERLDYQAALRRSDALVEIGSRMREGSEAPFALTLQALSTYGTTGRAEQLDQHLETLRQADAKQRLAIALNRTATLEIAAGRPEQALPRALEALQLASIMERPSELLQARLNLEAIHRQDSALWAESQMDAIEELAAGPVASWARKRALALKK